MMFHYTILPNISEHFLQIICEYFDFFISIAHVFVSYCFNMFVFMCIFDNFCHSVSEQMHSNTPKSNTFHF